jgi:hypothetical protein
VTGGSSVICDGGEGGAVGWEVGMVPMLARGLATGVGRLVSGGGDIISLWLCVVMSLCLVYISLLLYMVISSCLVYILLLL